MSIGMILLTAVAVLIFFGVAQRVLDKMHLSDKAALMIVASMFFLSLVPNIVIGRVAINLGGCVVPVLVCAYLLVKADSGKEVFRALIGAVITAGIVFALSRLMPNEPEAIGFDPNYAYGIAGGIVAYVLGKSRRGAFICGVLGVMIADIAVAVINWQNGIDQQLVLGGAGTMDGMVISGVLAVVLAELVGEVIERMTRGKKPAEHDRVETPIKHNEPEESK